MFYIELTSNQYNALSVTTAKANDSRFYLRGMCIHTLDNGSVVCTASNGMTLYQTTPIKIENGEAIADLPDIIVPISTLAKSKETVRLSFADDWKPGAECTVEFISKPVLIRKIVVQTIEGKFPDVSKAIPDLSLCNTPKGDVCFNPRLMWEVPNKLFGSDPYVLLKQKQIGDPFRVVMPKRPDDVLVVMPVRY